MNAPSTPPLFLQENPVAAPMPRTVERATRLALFGAGGALGVALFVFAVATQSGADAARIVGASPAQMPALIGALAASHGRPGAF